MEAIKKILDKNSDKAWRVPSKTNKKRGYHTVRLLKGELKCDCPALRECWHIKQVKTWKK